MRERRENCTLSDVVPVDASRSPRPTATLRKAYCPMTRRHVLCSLLLVTLAFLLLGCAGDNRSFNSLQLSPNSATLASPGSTVQFTATAIYNQGLQVGFNKNVTSQVTWSSSDPSVATVSASGLASAVNAGSATISATMQVSGGPATTSAELDVTTGPPPPRALNSITIIPANGAQEVYANGQTYQFIAIGTFNLSPTTQDVTGQVTWTSADVDVVTINSTGLATAINCATSPNPCQTVITASFNDPNSGLITSTSSLSTINNPNLVPLPSLTVYEVGQGTGTVVSSPVGINCSSGGNTASCTANFPLSSSPTAVTLTETPTAGSVFVGWSSNCNGGVNLTGSVCNVSMPNNQTVGAIFALSPTP